MLRRHGSVQPDSRASDSDADYRLATGSRILHLTVDRTELVNLGHRLRSAGLRGGVIGLLSGLLALSSIVLPVPWETPAYAQGFTSDAVQAAPPAASANDSQSWQPNPQLSADASSLFKLNRPNQQDQGSASNSSQQAANPQSPQNTDNAQTGQPASAPAPSASSRATTSSRGGSRPTPDISTHDKFIAAVAEAAQASQQDSGTPASVTIAQAILESDWGQSLLATKGQNYFGIKASKGPGPAGVINMNTWEVISGANVTVNDAFKAYHNLYESVMDHGRFLADNARYAAAFKVTNDPQEFARRIRAAGYATDPAYATKLINLMNKYNLYQYDQPQPGQ